MNQVNFSIADGIAVLGVNRPEVMNALSREIIDEYDRCIEELKNNREVRCLILYSEDNFAAGADINAMADCNSKEAREFLFSPTYNKIDELEIPVIAAIEGYALGGGLELALTADIRIISKEAKLGFPETSLGIFPGAGGTVRGPRIMGEAYAKEMIFTGKIITACEAEKMNLANHIVDAGKTYDEAHKMALLICKRGPIAVSMAKTTINYSVDEPNKSKAIENEMEKWSLLFETVDQKEGMRAFIEKRKPVFLNK